MKRCSHFFAVVAFIAAMFFITIQSAYAQLSAWSGTGSGTQVTNPGSSYQWIGGNCYYSGTPYRGGPNANITDDGNGGIIVSWIGYYYNASGNVRYQIPYVQRVNASGNTVWTSNPVNNGGVSVGSPYSSSYYSYNYSWPSVVSDGSGGCYVAWLGYTYSPSGYLYQQNMQHINNQGNPAWSNTTNYTKGYILTVSGNTTSSFSTYDPGIPFLYKDPSGGVLVTWYDYTSTYYQGTIHAAKINGDNGSSPSFVWGPTSVQSLTASTDELYPSTGYYYEMSPAITTDANGGAYVAWEGYSSNGSPYYSFNHIAHVAANGAVQWNNKFAGTPAANGSNPLRYLYYSNGYNIFPDGNGGCVLGYTVYYDQSDYYYEPYGVRVNSAGGAVWGPKNVVGTTNYGNAYWWQVKFASDGIGGLYVGGEQYYTSPGYQNWFIQHTNANGTILWNPSGTPAGINASNSTLSGPYYYIDGGQLCDDGTANYATSTPANLISVWTSSSAATYVQKFLAATGNGMWPTQTAPAAVQVSNSPSMETAQVMNDGAGGAFVLMNQQSYSNIYAQHIIDTAFAPHCSSAGSPLNVGKIRVGKTSLFTGPTITNYPGSQPTTQSALTVSGTSTFIGNGTTSLSSPSLPLLLAVNQTGALTVGVSPKKNGVFNDTLYLNNNSYTLPQAKIAVNGTGIYPHLTVAPTFLIPQGVHVASTYKIALPITNSGTDTLHITGGSFNSGNPGDFTLTPLPTVASPIAIPPNSVGNITIGFTPGASGQRVTQLQILSDDSQYVYFNTPATVSILGNGIYPHISYSSDSLNFPPVVARVRHATQSWAITNSGTDTLWIYGGPNYPGINGTYFSGTNATDFSIDPTTTLPMFVLPGNTGTVNVRFVPGSIGARTGFMQLVTNYDSVVPHTFSTAPLQVSLFGQGVDSAADFIYASVIQPLPAHVLTGVDTTRIIFNNLADATRRLLINSMTLTGADAAMYQLLNKKTYLPLSATFADTIAVGASDTLYLRFAPITPGTLPANLHIVAILAGTQQSAIDIPVIGIGNKASISVNGNLPMNFGNVGINNCDTLTMTVNNLGTAPTTLTSFTMLGAFGPDYSVINQNVAGTVIAPGAALNVTLAFCPAPPPGPENVTARILDSDGDTVFAAVKGTGVNPGNLVYGTTLRFPITGLGLSATKTLTMTNSGQLPVTITGDPIAGAPQIAYKVNASFPLTIAAGQTVNIPITFAPLGGGTIVDTLKLQSPAGKLPVVVLSGYSSTADFVLFPVNFAFNVTFSGGFNPNYQQDTTIDLLNAVPQTAVIDSAVIRGRGANAFTILYPYGYPHQIPGSTGDSIAIAYEPYQPNTDYQASLYVYAKYGTTDTTVIITLDGNSSATETKERGAMPADFVLAQNYPNPFSAATQISYSIPAQALVSLAVYDELGNMVRNLVSGVRDQGTYAVSFDASSLPSGVYYYRIVAGAFTGQHMMQVIR